MIMERLRQEEDERVQEIMGGDGHGIELMEEGIDETEFVAP